MPDEATITVRKPRLEPAAAAAITEIEAATGKRVTPQHVVWLQAAASDLVRPDRETPKLVDLPTECGGSLLWPLSYFAAEWYQQVAMPHYGDDYRVLGWTMAHAYDRETLGATASKRTVKRAVNDWLLTLSCGPAALREAVARVLGRDELIGIPNTAPGDAPVRADDWGDSIALLCDKYQGTDPLFWSCRVSIAYCQEMLARACVPLPDDKRPNAPSCTAAGTWLCIVAKVRAEVEAAP